MRVHAACLAIALMAAIGCTRGETDARGRIAPEDSAGEILWSDGGRCGAFQLTDKEGHSPMTTSRVGVVERGREGYAEVRLPAPNGHFSTYFEAWEGPHSLRVRATTLDGDVKARYDCRSRTVELLR